jgi:hypothetical protein
MCVGARPEAGAVGQLGPERSPGRRHAPARGKVVANTRNAEPVFGVRRFTTLTVGDGPEAANVRWSPPGAAREHEAASGENETETLRSRQQMLF